MSIVTTRQAVGDPLVKIETLEIWNIMKFKTKLVTLTFLACFLCVLPVHAQGDFKNLDFEAANISDDPLKIGYPIPVSDAMPGWKAYFGSLETDFVMHNALGLGTAVISIIDTNMDFGFSPLDGNYSVVLDEKYNGRPAIGQTVTIPNNSLSVVFLLRDTYSYKFEVSFEGQVLPYYKTWTGPDYDACGVDIKEFQGQTGEFRFTESNGGIAVLDDIQFSSEAVPEPGTALLFALGAILLLRVSPHP